MLPIPYFETTAPSGESARLLIEAATQQRDPTNLCPIFTRPGIIR